MLLADLTPPLPVLLVLPVSMLGSAVLGCNHAVVRRNSPASPS